MKGDYTQINTTTTKYTHVKFKLHKIAERKHGESHGVRYDDCESKLCPDGLSIE